MDEYFGIRILKAMKRSTNEYTIRTKKIDAKTLIIFGDSNHGDYFFGKDFKNLKSFEPIAVEISVLMKLLGQPQIKDLKAECDEKFNIYELIETKDKNGQMRTAGSFTRHVPGYHKGFINLGVYKTPDWSVDDWSESQLYWLPSSNLIDNSHVCKKTASCFHKTKRRNDMDKHEEKCKDIQEIITKQVQYGCTSNEVTKLSNILQTDFSQFPQNQFCCFDIETFKNDSVCVPVSIAVASTLDGPRYFEKFDDTPEAAYQMVADFMDYLLELQQMLLEVLPSHIKDAIENLQAVKEELSTNLPSNYQSKSEFFKIYKYFKNYEVLKIYGFNSRYLRTVEHFVKIFRTLFQHYPT